MNAEVKNSLIFIEKCIDVCRSEIAIEKEGVQHHTDNINGLNKDRTEFYRLQEILTLQESKNQQYIKALQFLETELKKQDILDLASVCTNALGSDSTSSKEEQEQASSPSLLGIVIMSGKPIGNGPDFSKPMSEWYIKRDYSGKVSRQVVVNKEHPEVTFTRQPGPIDKPVEWLNSIDGGLYYWDNESESFRLKHNQAVVWNYDPLISNSIGKDDISAAWDDEELQRHPHSG